MLASDIKLCQRWHIEHQVFVVDHPFPSEDPPPLPILKNIRSIRLSIEDCSAVPRWPPFKDRVHVADEGKAG